MTSHLRLLTVLLCWATCAGGACGDDRTAGSDAPGTPSDADGQALDTAEGSDVTTADVAPTADSVSPDSGPAVDTVVGPPPQLTRVSPRQVWARGGDALTLEGKHLTGEALVTVRGVACEVVGQTASTVTCLAPALLPGLADVALTVDGTAPLTLADAVTVEALPLTFERLDSAMVVAPGGGTVRDAVRFDIDADGDDDLVVATDGGLRLMVVAGVAGQLLLAPSTPGGSGGVRALATADIDGDGADELVACTSSGRELVFRGTPDGLVDAWRPAFREGACLAVTAGVTKGTGRRDVFSLHQHGTAEPGLMRWLDGKLFDGSLSTLGEDEYEMGTTASGDASAPPSFVRRADVDEGTGVGELSYTVTGEDPTGSVTLPISLDPAPERISLRIRGFSAGAVSVQPQLLDSAGRTFVGDTLSVGVAWSTLETSPVASWAPADGDVDTAMAVPVAGVGLMVSAEGLPSDASIVGSLTVDWIAAHHAETMDRLIAAFDDRLPHWQWANATRLVAASLDADDATDLIVIRSSGAPLVLTSSDAVEGDAFAQRTLELAGDGPYASAARVDSNGDGQDDLVVTSAQQDLLLTGAGDGTLSAAGLGSMPVDAVVATDIAAADLDLDGVSDLVIGHAGATDRLYRGLGDGRFADVTPLLGFDEVDAAVVVVADLNGDGAPDVVSFPADGDQPPIVRLATLGAP